MHIWVCWCFVSHFWQRHFKVLGVRITSALLRKRSVWYNKGFNDNFPVYFCILFVLHWSFSKRFSEKVVLQHRFFLQHISIVRLPFIFDCQKPNYYTALISDWGSKVKTLAYVAAGPRTRLNHRGVARMFQSWGHRGYSPDYIWFIPLLSLVYQRAQSYYRRMKAHIN